MSDEPFDMNASIDKCIAGSYQSLAEGFGLELTERERLIYAVGAFSYAISSHGDDHLIPVVRKIIERLGGEIRI